MNEDFFILIFFSVVSGIIAGLGLMPLAIFTWCVGTICFIVAKIEEYKFRKYAEELREKHE